MSVTTTRPDSDAVSGPETDGDAGPDTDASLLDDADVESSYREVTDVELHVVAAGDPDAPVDLYYWTDYLCPFCAQFDQETLPAVGRNHVDTGEVRLVALSYPNIGEYSMPAAVWSRCVWSQVAADDPAAFWRWHASVFEAQPESGTDWADEETFTRITEETEGVPLGAVDDCRTSRTEEIRESMDPNVAVAQSSRIRGTPGFVLYNRETETAGKLVGAHPYENFADAIEQVMES